MNELEKKALSLPLKERENLMVLLRRSLKDEDELKEKYKYFLSIAESLFGKGCRTKSRIADHVVGRAFIVWALQEHGYKISQIARTMKLTHSTILNLIAKKKNMETLPQVYKKENEAWKQFNKIRILY